MAPITASFTRTPQAIDDGFYWTEDDLLFWSGFNSAFNIATLDVMSNDLGGAAKKLWSIDNGDFLNDLRTNNVNTGWESTANGNLIRIDNGQIEFDISNLLIATTGVANVNALAAGVTITDSFSYAIQLGNGTLSSATVTFELVGMNDGPVANADAGSAGENETKSFDVLFNDTDIDAGDTKTLDSLAAVTVTSTNGVINGIDASAAFAIVGGQLQFTPGSLFDALDHDDTATVVVNYTMKDGQGAPSSSTLTVTVNGANDAATITATPGGDYHVAKDGGALSFAPLTYPVNGSFSSMVTVGDFNADGNTDLAVTNFLSHNVSVLLNAGDGTFGPPAVYATGFFPNQTAIGDVNHDGVLDIMVANAGADTVSILRGNADGSFQPQYTVVAGADGTFGSWALTLGDFNGDGNSDLAVSNFMTGFNNVSVLLGNGDGTFGAPTGFAAGTDPLGIATADLNGDGRFDLAWAGFGPTSSVFVALGNGDGTFQAPASFAAGFNPVSIAIGDLNGDGNPDIVTSNHASSSPTDSGISVLLGNGDGTFELQDVFSIIQSNTQAGNVALSDLNGDGSLDIVTANSTPVRAPFGVSVLLGNGDGTFQPDVIIPAGLAPQGVAVADFNGDGALDFAAPDALGNSVVVNTRIVTLGDPLASGDLNISDVDTGEAQFAAVASADLAGVYGAFTFDSDTGEWTYALDNLDPDTQALTAAYLVTDSLTVTSFDGSASHTITVQIHGANDYLL